MLAIDVTDVKRAAKVGDAVVLWGDGLPVEEVAVWAETAPYTLLCGINQRVAVSYL
jgi:alanine racemase